VSKKPWRARPHKPDPIPRRRRTEGTEAPARRYAGWGQSYGARADGYLLDVYICTRHLLSRPLRETERNDSHLIPSNRSRPR
jgi:hypothetical protein